MQQDKQLDDIFLRLAEMRGMLSVTQVGTVRGELRYRQDAEPDLRAHDIVIEKGWLAPEDAQALLNESTMDETPMPYGSAGYPPASGWSGDSVAGEDLQMELPPPQLRSGDSLFHDPFGQGGQDDFVDHTPSLTPTPEVFDEYVQSPDLEAIEPGQMADEVEMSEVESAGFDTEGPDTSRTAPGLEPSETAPGLDDDYGDDGHPVSGSGRVTTLGLDDTYEVLPEPGTDTAADSDMPRRQPPRFKLRGSKGAVDDFSEFGENEPVTSPQEMFEDSEEISQLISDSAVSEVMAQADDEYFGPPADLSESPDLLLDPYGMTGEEPGQDESSLGDEDMILVDEPLLDADESSDHGVMHREEEFIATVPPEARAETDDEESTRLDTTEISDVLVNPQAEFPVDSVVEDDLSESSGYEPPSTTRYATGEEARAGLRDRTDTMLGHESGPQSEIEEIEGSELTLADLRAQMGIGAGVKLSRHTHRMKKLAGSKRRYSVIREIARGGMGKVIEVEDNDLRRSVALKVLRKEMLARRDLVERFLEEAQITGQLEHPNIVPVHEIGVDGRGNLYFTMKLVEGETLSSLFKRLRKNDPEAVKAWPLARLIDVFIKVCEGVAFAHARGVIHRDLKPANIMVGRFGEVQIMDWGVAKIIGREDQVLRSVVSDRQEDDSSRTVVGSVLGTPSYMSPEQARGELDKVGPESDVFSLGVILYELLALVTPWTAKTSAQVLEQVKEEDPPTPSSRAPERKIPPELEQLAMKCLAKKPEKRVASASSLITDLRSWQEGRTLAAVQYSLGQLLSKWINRHKVAVLSTLLVILALMGGSIFAWRAAQQSSIDAATVAVAEADALIVEAESHLGAGLHLRAQELAVAAVGKYLSAQNTLGSGRVAEKLQRANEISSTANAQQLANDLTQERQQQQAALAEESRERFLEELRRAEGYLASARERESATDTDTTALSEEYRRARERFVAAESLVTEGVPPAALKRLIRGKDEIDAWLKDTEARRAFNADMRELRDLRLNAEATLRQAKTIDDDPKAEEMLMTVLSMCDRATAITRPGEAATPLHNEARRIKAEAALEFVSRAIRTERLDIAGWMVTTAKSTGQLADEVAQAEQRLAQATRDRSRFTELSATAEQALDKEDWALAMNQLRRAIAEGESSSFVRADEMARLRRQLEFAQLEQALATSAAATSAGQMEQALESFLQVEAELTDPDYKSRASSRIESLRRRLGEAQYEEAMRAEGDGLHGAAVTLYGKALKNLTDPTKRENAIARLEIIQTELAAGQASDRHMLLRRGRFEIGSNRDGDQNPQTIVEMREFLLIDTYLVTNEDYKKFVDAEGYLNDDYWHEDALPLRGSFVDTTGRPGPAGWVRGGFDSSLAKFPVTGVSWYEAAAYAKFVGKRLPTPVEWEIAAGAPELGMRPQGDYPFGERMKAPAEGVTEPREVGTAEWEISPGVPRDMGNNVAEWTSLRENGRAQVRGAEPGLHTELFFRYARRAKVSVAPLTERSSGRGFRCISEVRPQARDGNDE